jgi:hypothetical protein
MIAAGMIHPAPTPTTGPASPAPSVTIGAIRVSNRPASSAGGTQNSPDSEWAMIVKLRVRPKF